MGNTPNEFVNWLPVKLYQQNEEWLLDWIFMNDVPFTRPFFDETISAFKTKNSLEQNPKTKRTSTLDFLFEVADFVEAVPVELFIFHTSRCGSTLITQALCIDKTKIVVPEYLMIDAILRMNETDNCITLEKRHKLLKALIRVIGQKRFKEQQSMVIKLESWQFIFFNDLKKLFPESKQCIIFRDPDATFSSIQKMPAMQFVPEIVNPELFRIGFSREDYIPNEYFNQVMQSMYVFIREIASSNQEVLLLDYNNGMKDNIEKLISFMNYSFSETVFSAIFERLGKHSKHPQEIFTQNQSLLLNNIADETRSLYNEISSLTKST